MAKKNAKAKEVKPAKETKLVACPWCGNEDGITEVSGKWTVGEKTIVRVKCDKCNFHFLKVEK